MGRVPAGHGGGRRPRGRRRARGVRGVVADAARGARRAVHRDLGRGSQERQEEIAALDRAGAGHADRRCRDDDPGRPADHGLRLDGRRWSSRSRGSSRSATRSSCASRSAWSARSRRGTTRCTRSPPRSRRRWRPGCTVVLKPSEVTPLNAFVLAEVIDEVGVPAGVFNLVTGYGPVVGEAIAAHPGVDMVSFTGSTRAGPARQRGRRGHRQAGRARARRQVAERHPRRRRPREGGRQRHPEVLPELRPDVLRADADARPARAAAGGRGDRRGGRRARRRRRPVRRGHAARPARLRRPARARARLHRAGRRGGRASSSPAAPSRPRASTAATSCSRRSSATSRPR